MQDEVLREAHAGPIGGRLCGDKMRRRSKRDFTGPAILTEHPGMMPSTLILCSKKEPC